MVNVNLFSAFQVSLPLRATDSMIMLSGTPCVLSMCPQSKFKNLPITKVGHFRHFLLKSIVY